MATKLVQFGNNKLPKSTMIFNMGSSTNCPSKQRGLCQNCDICYAYKAERQYPQVLPYRTRQENFWLDSTAEEICDYFNDILRRKRNKVTALRFNEAGDFHSQECINKLDEVAEYLMYEWGVVTYGYTARKDLNFTNVSFKVMGSNFDLYGRQFKTVEHYSGDNPSCPGDCTKCNLCQHYQGTIEVEVH